MSNLDVPSVTHGDFKMRLESRVCLELIVGPEAANEYGKRFSNLEDLACHLNASDFGFGEGPDRALKAAFHLNSLLSKEKRPKEYQIDRTHKLADWVRPELQHLDYEKLLVVALSGDGTPITTETVATGSSRKVYVDVAASFKGAIACSATKIALAHNHPSGRAKPSEEDIELTEEFIEAGDILGIPVVDHVIIGKDLLKDGRDYFSIMSMDRFVR